MADYSRSFLLPVACEMTDKGFRVQAGGEEVVFEGELLKLTPACADVEFSIANDTYATLTATVNVKEDAQIDEVRWFAGDWSGMDQTAIASTDAVDICVFMRKNDVSFFLSLDFPYSKIEPNGVSYDPYDKVKSGEVYAVHTISVGAARLTGEVPDIGYEKGQFDRGEIEAMSEYVESRMPKQFLRSITTSACITNQMTDLREGRIFYSGNDNPTLATDMETLHKEVDLCAELGVEFMQVFEATFDFTDDGKSKQGMKELVEHGKRVGVFIGDYLVPGGVYCDHYNYDHRYLDRPEWRSMNKEGQRTRLCFGCEDHEKWETDTMVNSMSETGARLVCLDGWQLHPCYDPAHGHGENGGYYCKIRGFVRMMEAFNQISPDFLTWSNSGEFIRIAPKLLWYNPNVYLTDPHPRLYSASLNTLKYYGDCRREQMVSVHNRYFLPYTAYNNCEYYVFRFSRIHDLSFFEYSFLQSICVTPNIGFGELRTFLERVPSAKLDYVKGFMKKWIRFLKDNYDVWKNVYQIGDNPQVGANEVYAHTLGDHGYVCMVNQNHQPQTAKFTLDGSIGLSEGERYRVTEIYPNEAVLAEQALPYARRGDTLELNVPAFSVRIIKIEPWTEPETVQLYGIDGRVEKTQGGYAVHVSGKIGHTYEAAVVIPSETVVAMTAQTVRTVPTYTFPTRVSDIRTDGNVTRFRLKMPRDTFDPVVQGWRVDGSEPCNLGFENSDFCGAYIHNMYSEQQHTVLYLQTESCDQVGAFPALQMPDTVYTREIPNRASVYEAVINIPFIERSMAALPIGQDEVLELIFADAAMVKSLKVFINGVPTEYYTFRYAWETMRSFAVELVGRVASSTPFTLRVEVEWNDAVASRVQKNVNTTDGNLHVLA